MPAPLEESYKALVKLAAAAGLHHPSVSDALISSVRTSLDLLGGLDRRKLESRVIGKEYFAFEASLSGRHRSSRGINSALFMDDPDAVIKMLARVISGDIPDDPVKLHCALYTAAISYPAGTDVSKDGDKKSPGTFLENFVGHLVASTFGVRPTTTVISPTLDLEIRLPTDLVFDLGKGRSRIHLPVKASTRERVIQVWAHQRVLDGMHGVNRFRGLLVVLAETNRQLATNSIVEVCLPDQWTAYQMYIAQLHRVYYFDLPDKYRRLRETYPFLEVKPFADFFYEFEEIARPSTAVVDSVEAARPPTALAGFPEHEEVGVVLPSVPLPQDPA